MYLARVSVVVLVLGVAAGVDDVAHVLPLGRQEENAGDVATCRSGLLAVWGAKFQF